MRKDKRADNMRASSIQRELLSNISQSMRATELRQKRVTSQRTRARNSQHALHQQHQHQRHASGESHLQEHQREWKKEYGITLPPVGNKQENGGVIVSPINSSNDLKSDTEFEQAMLIYNTQLAAQRLPPSFIDKGKGDPRINTPTKSTQQQHNTHKHHNHPQHHHQQLSQPNGRQNHNTKQDTIFPQLRESKSVSGVSRTNNTHTRSRTHSDANILHSKSNDPQHNPHLHANATTTYTMHHMPKKASARKVSCLSMISPSKGGTKGLDSHSYLRENPYAVIGGGGANKEEQTRTQPLTPEKEQDKERGNGIDENTKKLLKRAKRLSSQFKEQEAQRLADIYSHMNANCTASTMDEEPAPLLSLPPTTTSPSTYLQQSPSSPGLSSPSPRPLTSPRHTPSTTSTEQTNTLSISNTTSQQTNTSGSRTTSANNNNRHITRQLSRQISQNFSSSPPPTYVRMDSTSTISSSTPVALQPSSSPPSITSTDNNNKLFSPENSKPIVKKQIIKRQLSRKLSRMPSRVLTRKPSQNIMNAKTPSYVRLDSAVIDSSSSHESYDVFDQEPLPAKKLTPAYKGTSGRKQKQLQTGISFGNEFDDQNITCGTEVKRSHMKIAIRDKKKHFIMLEGQEIW